MTCIRLNLIAQVATSQHLKAAHLEAAAGLIIEFGN